MNERGAWVRVRELNYLIGKGIITVDEEALREYVDREDEEFNAMIRSDSEEDRISEMLGRELTDTDRQFYEAAKRAVHGEE
ncbi:MAG: hypothetical protein IJ088_14760 [Clostridia bacterium]|nr:hypothetical protein [Clostridia bacterium]